MPMDGESEIVSMCALPEPCRTSRHTERAIPSPKVLVEKGTGGGGACLRINGEKLLRQRIC
jgi:hypothetical protein